MFRSFPGFHPPRAKSPLPPAGLLITSPDIDQCPLGVKTVPGCKCLSWREVCPGEKR